MSLCKKYLFFITLKTQGNEKHGGGNGKHPRTELKKAKFLKMKFERRRITN